MNKSDAESVFTSNFHTIGSALINQSGDVNSAIADTNANGWGAETYDNLKIMKVSNSSFNFTVEIVLTGDSDPERGWNGDEFTVDLSGTFKHSGDDGWYLDTYEVRSLASNVRLGDDDD